MEDLNKITDKIIGCCFKVHSELGPGFNEKVYHNALKLSLEKCNLKYDTEKEFIVSYEKKRVGRLKVDLIVENKVIVEIKAIVGILPTVFKYQLISYLKVADLPVGLLVNFGNKSCEIKRIMSRSV